MTEAPSWAHWLGTDSSARDILSRILFGAHQPFVVGITSAVVGGASGLVLGVGSAYFGGRIDLFLQRILDIVMSFPLIIMALAVVSIFWHGGAERHHRDHHPADSALRARSAVERAAIREVPYVDAARALGYSHSRIILNHMVPNVAAPFLNHADVVRRPGDPRRGVALLSRARRAGAVAAGG